MARVAEEIQKVLGERLIRGLRDPLPGFVTIKDVEVTSDFTHAKVFVSVFGSDAQKKGAIEGLNAQRGFLRGEVGKQVRLRHTPTLSFVLDESAERAARVHALLDEVRVHGTVKGVEAAPKHSDTDETIAEAVSTTTTPARPPREVPPPKPAPTPPKAPKAPSLPPKAAAPAAPQPKKVEAALPALIRMPTEKPTPAPHAHVVALAPLKHAIEPTTTTTPAKKAAATTPAKKAAAKKPAKKAAAKKPAKKAAAKKPAKKAAAAKKPAKKAAAKKAAAKKPAKKAAAKKPAKKPAKKAAAKKSSTTKKPAKKVAKKKAGR